MYGHDPRVFRFSPDENIKGGHSPPQNHQYWEVGCLGIAPACSKVKIKNDTLRKIERLLTYICGTSSIFGSSIVNTGEMF